MHVTFNPKDFEAGHINRAWWSDWCLYFPRKFWYWTRQIDYWNWASCKGQ